MGLIQAIAKFFSRRPSFEASATALLQDLAFVARKQAEATTQIAAALDRIGAFYEPSEAPDRWVSEDENQMLKEMMEEYAKENGVTPEVKKH